MKTKILKLDIDLFHEYDEKYHLLNDFIETRKILLKNLGYEMKKYRIEKTKHGYHLWIELKNEITVTEAIKLQFLLGDDIKRCNFNFMRLELGEDIALMFNILFTKKEKKS